jgi:hypothetical protein
VHHQKERVLAQRGILAMDRLSELLRLTWAEDVVSGSYSRVVLPEGTVSEVEFRRITGLGPDGVTPQTETVRLLWRPLGGEVQDGLDNNENGMADEGELVEVRADGTERLLALNVPAGGLTIEDGGDGFLSFHLEVLEPAEPGRGGTRSRRFAARVPVR